MRDQTAKDNQKGAPLYLLAIACLLFIFGLVAQTVVEGKSSAFDRSIILAFRDHGNPSAPIGPAWVQEAARDLTSLGSIIVLIIITVAIAGYLFLARKQAAAWLMLVAVFGGIALSDLLKPLQCQLDQQLSEPIGVGTPRRLTPNVRDFC